mgnify:CR=1 FL=1
MVDIVVKGSGEQVVGGGDCVDIAGEMQVDVCHGDHLRVPPPCGAPFHPKHGPKARLSQRRHSVLSDFAETVAQAYAGARLSLPEPRRRQRGAQDQLSVWLVLQGIDVRKGDFSLVPAVCFQLVVVRIDSEGALGNVRNRLHVWNVGVCNCLVR